MKNCINKLKIISELLKLSERAFLHKLKKKKPNLTESEIALELKNWYLHRPGAEYGDGEGVPGNLDRFK